MKKRPHASLSLPGLPYYWNDARVASISLLGLAAPNGPINSYNLPSCAYDFDDSGNTGSGCVS